ncbi:MAG TPA: prephenate dehydrogenase/arogenate dehydrogenase family protein, partial [Candidatus Dormibacteraeota bacterium]|nr:prephenate dehydrogenase/arogenate dehydrogenase family protein [Candidatus Dormibacteraeota bacterium]
MKAVAIVGLGLIGGSLGLALKEHLPEVDVLGVARRPETAAEALAMGAADRAGTDLALVREADLVVLACPLAATAAVLEASLPHLAAGARVTDVGSVKAAVVTHALSVLDHDRNPFLGGHPMAGKEVTGIAQAEAALFRGRPWILTQPQAWFNHLSGPESAIAAERGQRPGGYELQGWQDYTAALRAIGALPVFMPPARHDRYVAMISHLPFLLSAAFLLATGEQEDWGEASQLASSGFRDISRLGAGDPEMYTAIAGLNRDEVLKTWSSLHRALDMFEAALARGEEGALLELFRSAREVRNSWS